MIFFYIPVYHRFKFFGIQISDKSFTYLFCLQLLFNNFPSSFLNGIIGLISGIIYVYEPSGLSKFVLPKSLANFCKKYIEGFIVTPYDPSNLTSRRNEMVQRRFRRLNRGENVNQQQNLSDENINALMEMGFTRDQSIEALTNSNNDLNEAINYLIVNQ